MANTDQNESQNDSGVADEPPADYDMDDNVDEERTAGTLPNLHISEDDDLDVMGEWTFYPSLHM